MASEQVAISCIEQALSIVDTFELPLNERETRELSRFRKIYSELGGVFDTKRQQSKKEERQRSIKQRKSTKLGKGRGTLFASDKEVENQSLDVLIAEVRG